MRECLRMLNAGSDRTRLGAHTNRLDRNTTTTTATGNELRAQIHFGFIRMRSAACTFRARFGRRAIRLCVRMRTIWSRRGCGAAH